MKASSKGSKKLELSDYLPGSDNISIQNINEILQEEDSVGGSIVVSERREEDEGRSDGTGAVEMIVPTDPLDLIDYKMHFEVKQNREALRMIIEDDSICKG